MIIISIWVISAESKGSIIEIVESGIFGCHSIENVDSGIENFITSYTLSEIKIDEYIQALYGGEEPDFEIVERFAFSDCPDLLMFSAFMWTSGSVFKYQKILFNISDSTIYYFDGDDVLFSKVMQGCLAHISDDNINTLIKLYVSTISPDAPRYFIDSMEGFLTIIDSLGHTLKINLREEMQHDIKRASKVIQPYKYDYVNGIYKVECFVWDMYARKLYRYKFRVSEKDFEITKKEVALENVGSFGARW
jgi:hypothetical protein